MKIATNVVWLDPLSQLPPADIYSFMHLRQVESSFEGYTPKPRTSIVIVDLPHEAVQIRSVYPSPHCLFSRAARKGSDVLPD
jgi:hypothetical protein